MDHGWTARVPRAGALMFLVLCFLVTNIQVNYYDREGTHAATQKQVKVETRAMKNSQKSLHVASTTASRGPCTALARTSGSSCAATARPTAATIVGTPGHTQRLP